MQPLVYIVDDDPPTLRAMNRLLSACGYRVQTFESPMQFLHEHDRDVPGCVVADVMMPELNGLELLGALKAQGNARPFVFVTGEPDFPTAARVLHVDAIAILAKPVDETSLREAIDRAIEADRRTRGAA
ncbi:MAG TPA: response regulator [Usitatibacter sp.]|nr:response regulator [Usitatibacter sp.]